MNPIVHGELSWLLAQPLGSRRDRAIVTLAGLAPDLDGLTLLGGADLYGRFHHVLTHGFLPAAVVVVGVFALARQRWRAAGLAMIAFHLHLACDLLGSGPGWPLFYLWPLTEAEVYWSGQWDLASWQNALIAVIVSVACLGMALPLRRTIVELFSTRVDSLVVAAVRARLGRLP